MYHGGRDLAEDVPERALLGELGLNSCFSQGLGEGEDPLLRSWAMVITPGPSPAC